MTMRVAFDIGGTFTDFVLEDGRAGALHFHKVPTTPHDPAEAVLEGLEVLLRAAKVGVAEVSGILHATTVATNAILERKGARTALITTAGFRDIIIIGRQKRYDTYDMYLAKPVPLVRRRDVFEVARARACRRHDRAAARSGVARARSGGGRRGRTTSRSRSACCTPTPRPRTRRRSARRLAGAAFRIAVSLSSDVSPKFREYERASTVVANAYIKPIVSRYVSRLTGALEAAGHHGPTSSSCSRTAGSCHPSSPATCRSASSNRAPQRACCCAASSAGRRASIACSPSTWAAPRPSSAPSTAASRRSRRPSRSTRCAIARAAASPSTSPPSSCWRSAPAAAASPHTDMGLIKVGPESAGADPGPVCYRRGGTQADRHGCQCRARLHQPRLFQRRRHAARCRRRPPTPSRARSASRSG